MEKTGKDEERPVGIAGNAGYNVGIGALLGFLGCWFYTFTFLTGRDFGFYYVEPYYFSGAWRYTPNYIGPVVILLGIAILWLVYFVIRNRMNAAIWIAILIIFLGLIAIPIP